MADMVTQKNIAALETIRLASGFSAVAAGAASSGAAVTGMVFQRSQMKLPRNAALALMFTATLAATKTLYLGTVKIRDSADGNTFADYLVFTDPGLVATGPTNGGTVTGQVTLNCGLAGARDYIEVVFTPTLSNTTADTATVIAILAFAGFDRLPAAA